MAKSAKDQHITETLMYLSSQGLNELLIACPSLHDQYNVGNMLSIGQ